MADNQEQPEIYIPSAEENRRFVELVAATWSDSDLAVRYLTDARAVLTEFGIELSGDVPAPPLPPRPEGDLSVEELEAVAGGLECCAGSAGTAGTAGGCIGTVGTFGSFCG